MAMLEYFFAFLVSAFLTGYVKRKAEKWGMMDIPNIRSIHTKYIPKSAGIALFLTVSLTLLLFQYEMVCSYFWIDVAVFLVLLTGVLDDLYEVSPTIKFFIIALSTLFLSFDGFLIDNVGTYWGRELSLGWLALPFTIFAVTGFTNALNLVDGLDGLAGTLSIVILLGFFMVGLVHDDLFMMYLSGAFVASLLAFLLYNWHPASIFMGDSGSLTLGFVISLLAIKSLDYIPTVSILFIGAVPILDTLVVMIRRKRRGRSMFSADQCHIHHILRHFFSDNTPRTVIALGVMQAIYTLTGLQLEKNMDEGYLLMLFLLNVLLLYLFLNAMIKRQKRDC